MIPSILFGSFGLFAATFLSQEQASHPPASRLLPISMSMGCNHHQHNEKDNSSCFRSSSSSSGRNFSNVAAPHDCSQFLSTTRSTGAGSTSSTSSTRSISTLVNASTRRNIIISIAIATAAAIPSSSRHAWATDDGTTTTTSSDVTVRLNSPKDKLGLGLTVVKIGTNPIRSVVAVQSVDPFGMAARQSVEVGMILPDYPDSSSLLQRLKEGRYPVDLKFVNLAGGGDAYGDLGKTIVTAEDALTLARKQSAASAGSSGTSAGSNINPDRFDIRTIRQPPRPDICTVRSRRGDVLEIQYTASYYDNTEKMVVYDSSAQRGTGQPYQFVLGSGDMLPGVDQGLYDMCPGEMREIDIPKRLGYGDRGNKLFRVPAGVRLKWTVELIDLL